MKENLESISTKQLLAELNRRGEDKNSNSTETIRKRIKTSKLTFAVEVNEDEGYGVTYTLGVIKNGKFLDFYYNSGMNHEEFQKFIPNNFHESCESTYEYHAPNAKKDKHGLTIPETNPSKALTVLKKAGYIQFNP